MLKEKLVTKRMLKKFLKSQHVKWRTYKTYTKKAFNSEGLKFKQIINFLFMRPYSLFIDSFDWSLTKEGRDFWEGIHNIWAKILSDGVEEEN